MIDIVGRLLEINLELETEITRLREENARLQGEVDDLRATLRNCLTDANFMRAAAAAIREGEKEG